MRGSRASRRANILTGRKGLRYIITGPPPTELSTIHVVGQCMRIVRVPTSIIDGAQVSRDTSNTTSIQILLRRRWKINNVENYTIYYYTNVYQLFMRYDYLRYSLDCIELHKNTFSINRILVFLD